MQLPCPLPMDSRCVLLLAHLAIYQPGSSTELWYSKFYCGFYIGMMIKSMAMWLNSISSLLPSPGMGLAQDHYPLITWLVFLLTSPILKLCKGPPWMTSSLYKDIPITQEISRFLEAPCQELWTKTQQFFIILRHLKSAFLLGWEILFSLEDKRHIPKPEGWCSKR